MPDIYAREEIIFNLSLHDEFRRGPLTASQESCALLAGEEEYEHGFRP